MITCPQHGVRYITPEGQACTKCAEQHRGERVGKVKWTGRTDRPLRWDYDSNVVTKTMTPEAAAAHIRAVAADPMRLVQANLLVRRPPGVSKERFNIAVRAAGGEPMLTAAPSSVRFGLDYNRSQQEQRQKSLPKMGVAERIYVKPKSLKVAKYGRNSAYWSEREWLIFALKYSRGYVVRTDIGDESSCFNSIGLLKAAIRDSGWEIVR